MRIGFNARTLSAPQLRGWSRYTSNLCRELTRLGVEVVLFSDRHLNEEWLKEFNKEKLKVVVKKGKNYLHWEQVVLPSLCRQSSVDVLHCPINYGLPLFSPCPRVLTLHDAIDKVYYGQDKSWVGRLSPSYVYMRFLHSLSQIASQKIITVSEHAKGDLVEHYGIQPSKIDVIYEAADPLFSEASVATEGELKKRFKIEKPYFFYVGGLEKRKNISFLLESFAQLNPKDYQLVIAGGGSLVEKHREHVRRLKMEEAICFLGWVEEKDLPSLYKHSKAFIYPSHYEGFGLQIVEAMAMGAPVLASNKTSLPEILSWDEGTFDPDNKEELCSLVNRLIMSHDFFLKGKEHSQKRCKDFSWRKTAEETLTTYQKLVSR